MEVAIIQTDLVWEDQDANLNNLEELIKSLNSTVDLVVLPEMFNTGFSMNSADLAESMNGKTISWMKQLSISSDLAIAGSIMIKDNKANYNRFLFVKPDGSLVIYDKGHLFRMEKENSFFKKGDRPVITRFMGFNINLQICYDLRFPVWSRCINNNYDLLIYIASWPESRRHVWNNLLIARAIENQCYVIGVNRVGRDGNGIDYSGDSVIIGPKGETVASIDPDREGVATAILSIDELNKFRKKFPVWKDSDSFRLT